MASDEDTIGTTGGAFILFSIRCIVDHPDAVQVHETVATRLVVLEVRVHPDDLRRVIGKQGHTVQALRALLQDIGGRERQHYHLELVEASGRIEEVATLEADVPAEGGERSRGGDNPSERE